MRFLSMFVCAFIILAVVGCSSGPKTMQSAEVGIMPPWMTKLPNDPNYIFSAKTATSQDLQLAIDKAATDARAEVARTVEVRVTDMQKKFTEETGTNTDAQLLQMFTSATKTVVAATISGSRIREQLPLKDGSIWRAYVLMEYPIGAANAALMQQIKNNEQMYTKFRATQTFKELDDEVKKYEDWKKSQQPQQ